MFIAIDINKRFKFVFSKYNKNILICFGFVQISFSPSWKIFRETFILENNSKFTKF